MAPPPSDDDDNDVSETLSRQKRLKTENDDDDKTEPTATPRTNTTNTTTTTTRAAKRQRPTEGEDDDNENENQQGRINQDHNNDDHEMQVAPANNEDDDSEDDGEHKPKRFKAEVANRNNSMTGGQKSFSVDLEAGASAITNGSAKRPSVAGSRRLSHSTATGGGSLPLPPPPRRPSSGITPAKRRPSDASAVSASKQVSLPPPPTSSAARRLSDVSATKQQQQLPLPVPSRKQVTNLRMPSKHTPGKLMERETARRTINMTSATTTALPPPSTSRRGSNQTVPLPPPSSRRLSFGGSGAAAAVAKEKTTNANLTNDSILSPSQQKQQTTPLRRPSSAGASTAEKQQQQTLKQSSVLYHQTYVWFFLIFGVKLLCWQVWIHPILSSVVSSSDAATAFYQSVLPLNTVVEVTREIPPPLLLPPPEPIVKILDENETLAILFREMEEELKASDEQEEEEVDTFDFEAELKAIMDKEVEEKDDDDDDDDDIEEEDDDDIEEEDEEEYDEEKILKELELELEPLPVPPPIIKNQTIYENVTVPNQELVKARDELDATLDTLEKLIQPLNQSLATLGEEASTLEALIEETRSQVQAAVDHVEQATAPLKALLGDRGGEDVENRIRLGALDSARNSMHPDLSSYLLDLSFLRNWNFPNITACDDEDLANATKTFFSEEDLEVYHDAFVLEVAHSAENCTFDKNISDDIRKWVRDEITMRATEIIEVMEDVEDEVVSQLEKKQPPAIVVPDDDEEEDEAILVVVEEEDEEEEVDEGIYPSLDKIQKIINARLEIERADQTGRIDYASVMNGASVIRTGERATSPSLKDNLPFLNRLGAHTNYLFHGYGPEMALTPTHPPNALGQCWSFVKTSDSEVGDFATLSIRLAQPITVELLSIEHPPEDISDQVGAAIRNFRVLGFEDPDAEGKPWPLGSLKYQSKSAIRQDFELSQKVKGVRVPKLRSLTIGIDSNNGNEYACLYRVRVYGSE